MIRRIVKKLMKNINKGKTMLNIEKIAAGLRRCKVAPDFFLSTDTSVDLKDVCGIPIYVLFKQVNIHPIGDSDLCLLPVWKNELDNYGYEFERGYDEY